MQLEIVNENSNSRERTVEDNNEECEAYFQTGVMIKIPQIAYNV